MHGRTFTNFLLENNKKHKLRTNSLSKTHLVEPPQREKTHKQELSYFKQTHCLNIISITSTTLKERKKKHRNAKIKQL